MFNRGIIPLQVIVLGLCIPILAMAHTWQTITSGWGPSRIAATDQGLWAACEGGLLFLDPNTLSLEVRNKDQGLFSNGINVVQVEPSTGELWVGYMDGALDRVNTHTGRVVQRLLDLYEDQDVFSIYDISFSGGSAYVATDVGVHRLEATEYDGIWVVKENYEKFSNWDNQTKIWRVLATNSLLFAGSEQGIAIGSLDGDLFFHAGWNLYEFGDEIMLPEGTDDPVINFISEAGDEVFIGVKNVGMYRFTGAGFEILEPVKRCYGITESGNSTVYVAGHKGFGRFDTDNESWDYFLPDSMKLLDVIWAFDALWGVYDTANKYIGGIARMESEDVDLVIPNTPGGNQVYAVNVAPSGDLWITANSPRVRGAFRLHDGLWDQITKLNTTSPAFSYSLYAIGFDQRGGTWIGTRGSGLLHITEQDGELVTQYFDASESTGARLGYYITENFVLVSGFAVEPDSGIWMTNSLSNDDRALLYVPLTWYDDQSTEWIKYGRDEGLETNEIKSIIRDETGRLWMGSMSADDSRSLVILDPGGTPSDYLDDIYTDFGSETGFELINSMAIDRDGYLWLGTSDGLFYVNTLDSSNVYDFESVNVPLGEEEVIAVTTDPLGHIWVGTRSGVSMLDNDRFTWVSHYTSSSGQYSSPLVDDEVTSLAFNDATGDLIIGTNEGLSILSTPYRRVGSELGSISVRPQPFFVGDSQTLKLNFVGNSLVPDAKVRIFTPSGLLIRQLSYNQAASGWDGRRDDGDWTASGVYLVVVTGPDGNSEIGKIAVIRK